MLLSNSTAIKLCAHAYVTPHFMPQQVAMPAGLPHHEEQRALAYLELQHLAPRLSEEDRLSSTAAIHLPYRTVL